jgi:hypothetical protein
MTTLLRLLWTAADAAELDVLVWALTTDYHEHRQRCEACQPCPEPERWQAHKAACRVCQGKAPLTYGTDCIARDGFQEHFRSCPRCLPCQHLQKAVAEVVEWREARILLSRAEALRANLEERAA